MDDGGKLKAGTAADSVHKMNNTVAALMVNLDFVQQVLGDSSPDTPLMTEASPIQRAEVLKSLSLAMRSCRKLVELLRAME